MVDGLTFTQNLKGDLKGNEKKTEFLMHEDPSKPIRNSVMALAMVDGDAENWSKKDVV